MRIKLSFLVASIQTKRTKEFKKKIVPMGDELVFLTSINTTAGETASL
jgi:hypothetical protein